MVWLIAEDYMSDKFIDEVTHWKEIEQYGSLLNITCLIILWFLSVVTLTNFVESLYM